MRILILAALGATVLGGAPASAAGDSLAAKKARGCTIVQPSLPIGKLPTLGPVARCSAVQAIAATCTTQRYHSPSGKMSTVRRCDDRAAASTRHGGGQAAAD